ncbi:MAG TPA: hypothetical protein VF459_17660 [Caulobacteraceae bacterium]
MGRPPNVACEQAFPSNASAYGAGVIRDSGGQYKNDEGRRPVKTHLRFATLAVALLGVAAAPIRASAETQTTSDAASARPTGAVADDGSLTQPNLGEKRAAVAGVSADASAVLAAIQSDPKLLGELARNPAGGAALLRAHGATQSEHIAVSATGGGGALRRTSVTIVITIDNVTITIKF